MKVKTLRRQINTAFEGKSIRVNAYSGADGVDNPDKPYQDRNPLVNEVHKPKTNKQTFKNKRAQDYISIADRFYLTYRAVEHGEYQDPDNLISICSDMKYLAKLRSEMCRIPLKPNGAGLKQIMTKIEMRSLGIKSPNLADSVTMAFSATGLVKPKRAKHIKIDYRHRA